MNLKVLSSGSNGNGYLLESDTDCLVIEAGVAYMKVKEAIDFNVKKIVGVIASHVHNDHCKHIGEYEKEGIPTYKPYDETKSCPLKIKYGNFYIQAFKLQHDVPCYGFYITHPDIGKLIYLSDTEYCKYHFSGINHMLVEANYCKEDLDRESANFNHILTGHMELQTTLDFIHSNDNPNLRTVCLIHLSEKNADSTVFKEKAQQVTKADVYVAKKGLEVNLDLIPF